MNFLVQMMPGVRGKNGGTWGEARVGRWKVVCGSKDKRKIFFLAPFGSGARERVECTRRGGRS